MLQKYESFKDQLPDTSWLKEYLPDPDRIDAVRQKVKLVFQDISVPQLPDIQVRLPFCYSILFTGGS
jgi:hypothetical protein